MHIPVLDIGITDSQQLLRCHIHGIYNLSLQCIKRYYVIAIIKETVKVHIQVEQ